MNKKNSANNFLVKCFLLISFTGFNISNANPDDINKFRSIEELNSEFRKHLLSTIDSKDEEVIRNYKELLKMIYIDDFDKLLYKVDYNFSDYKEVLNDECSNSDAFHSRILFPVKRKPNEYSNWITNIQLNPKAMWILTKAAFCCSSWNDLLYILKKTRPGISDIQIKALKSRSNLFFNPMPKLGIDYLKIESKYSDYIYAQVTYCFMASLKKPFNAENFKIAKAIILESIVVASKQIITDMVKK